jgi:Kef-type K+ transport system membrane component KefB
MNVPTYFTTNFNLSMVALILVVAFVSKIDSVLLGARISGMRINREAWAIGFGLNARCATGIILASVGLANHVISEEIFVSIVIMAIVTSMVSGPANAGLLKHKQTAPAQPNNHFI